MQVQIENTNQQFKEFQKSKEPIKIIQKQHSQEKYQKRCQYQFYTKQTWKNGAFDLRFKSIIQSPINYGAVDQFKFAVSFQWKKNIIHWGINKDERKVLQTVKQKEFNSKKNEIKAYWLGHASVLLSIDSDTRIIIDPIFDKRVMPVVGQARHHQPPCKVDQLPKIDCVLISHDHFDHCNTNSLQKIYDNNKNNNVFFLIGKNSSDVLPKQCRNKHDYLEMSWTDSYLLRRNNKNIKITFVPACHWSKRSVFDQNKRLWGGFVIQALGKKIYFAGDTGYCKLFPELYQEFKGFDLSLLPIGAYEPNQQLKAQHVNPEQAVLIHNKVKSKLSVGIHWGTFPMSHEKPDQVLRDLLKAQQFVEQGKFITINIGESVVINKQEQQLIKLDQK